MIEIPLVFFACTIWSMWLLGMLTMWLFSLPHRRARKRLAEIKALLRRQNDELAQRDAGAQHQATASAWVDVYVLAAPAEDE